MRDFKSAPLQGSIYILRRLHESGGEVDAKTWDNWTPLMEAVENSHEDAVDLLLEWGADPSNRSLYGSTPLNLTYHPFRRDRDRDIELNIVRALEQRQLPTTVQEDDLVMHGEFPEAAEEGSDSGSVMCV